MMIRLPTSLGEWIAAIAGLFIVPAIGSAFWDFLAKPLALKTADRVRTLVMRILTLGLDHAESSLFADIGKRNHIHPAVAAWFAASFFISGEVGREMGRTAHPSPDTAAFLASGNLSTIFFGICGFALVVCFYKYMRTSLMVSYIRKFDHAMAVYGPFLSETQRLILHSKFATMKDHKDYRAVLEAAYEMSKETREKVWPTVVPESPNAT